MPAKRINIMNINIHNVWMLWKSDVNVDYRSWSSQRKKLLFVDFIRNGEIEMAGVCMVQFGIVFLCSLLDIVMKKVQRSVTNEFHTCSSDSFLKIGRQGKELEGTLGALFPRNEASLVSQTRILDHPSWVCVFKI